ncbi:MAG: SMI1/KNR4 family protein [Myxococcota bacterium]
MSDATSVRVEDLELSVRSMGLLLVLGVETLGDLLALPSIATTKMVVAELTAVLAEHGLTYEGTWDLPETPPAREATGSVTERWHTIEAWMAANAPDALGSLRRPASPEAIAAAEKELGVTLPLDYKELLARHDGQGRLGPMVAYCSLLPVGELFHKRERLAGLMDEWKPGWIPIGQFQRDYMVLDLVPLPGGIVGQIFVCHVDDDRRTPIAASCSDLLARYFRELQDGTIDLT